MTEPCIPVEYQRVRNALQSPRVQRFVRNMRVLREQKGWTAQRLEEEVLKAALREGVESTLNRNVIVNLENARRAALTLDEALLFAATLNTTVSWLADFDGPACTHCQDAPPPGYACKVCLADHDVRWRPEVHNDSE